MNYYSTVTISFQVTCYMAHFGLQKLTLLLYKILSCLYCFCFMNKRLLSKSLYTSDQKIEKQCNKNIRIHICTSSCQITLMEKKLFLEKKITKPLKIFCNFFEIFQSTIVRWEKVMNLAYLPRLSKGKSNSTLLGFEGALLQTSFMQILEVLTLTRESC